MATNLVKVTGDIPAAGTAKVDRRRAPETAGRILDAAERLFSIRGYHGVSLRDIATDAGVQVALTHYHFGSKETLFGAVIERRAADHSAALARALEQARAVAGTVIERRAAIIRAFVAPIVERSMRGGPGWKNYIRLLSLVANLPQEEAFVLPFHAHYDDVVDGYIAALRDVWPDMSEANVHWSFYFLQSIITHVMVESGLLDRQTRGAISSHDLDVMLDRLVPFVVAGMGGLASH